MLNQEAVQTGYRTAALSGQTDSSVSRQWASRPDDEKFLSLSALRDAVAKRTLESVTVKQALPNMRVHHENGLALDLAGDGST